MLLMTLLMSTALLMMSPYRVWLLCAVGGAAFVGALLSFAGVLLRVLPDELKLFDGVLSFLLLSACLIWVISWSDSLSRRDQATGLKGEQPCRTLQQ